MASRSDQLNLRKTGEIQVQPIKLPLKKASRPLIVLQGPWKRGEVPLKMLQGAWKREEVT